MTQELDKSPDRPALEIRIADDAEPVTIEFKLTLTPGIVEAGVNAISDYDRQEDCAEDYVQLVFIAMITEATKSLLKP